MSKTLRVVRAPGDCLGLTLPKDKPLAVGRMLFRAGALGAAKFVPPDSLRELARAKQGILYAGEWIAACCRRFKVGPRWLLTIVQAEQGLVTSKISRSPAWTTRHITGPKAPLFPREKRMRTGSKSGWLAVAGDWKMMAAAGYSIPDPGKKAYFSVEQYLGFPRQVFHAAAWLWRRELEFTKLESRGRLPKVKLYTGETVLCADRYAYKTLRYTPSEKVMAKRGKVYRMLARLGGEIWA
jgi:hypothetical protein